MANTPLGPDKDKAFLTGSTAFTPQWRYLDVDGKRVLSVYIGSGYWLIPTQENLRAFFAALSGGNNWDGDNNSTGYWAGRNFITSSYGGTLAAGDASFGNLILSSLNTGRKGLTTKENAINKWFVGQDADGKFKIQRRDGSNWVDVFVVDTSNNVFSAQSAIYSADGGATGTTISSNGVSNNTQGFVFSNATRIAEVTGNAIAITDKTNNQAISLRPDRLSFAVGDNQLSLNTSPTTNNRSQTFQDKSGVIALLSDITAGTAGSEQTSNKKITLTNSDTDYPSTSAVTTALALYIPKTAYASQQDFINRTTIVGLGDSFWGVTGGFTPLDTLSKSIGFNVYNAGVGGQTSTQILSRWNSLPDQWNYIVFIEAGRNDLASMTVQQTLDNIAAMVAKIPHGRYLVESVYNSTAEPSGSANYIKIKQINDALSATYGVRYADSRAYIVSQYNPSIPQDVTDFGNDVPPTSLHIGGDPLHLNGTGATLRANFLYGKILPLLTNDTVVSANNIRYELNAPVPIGVVKPNIVNARAVTSVYVASDDTGGFYFMQSDGTRLFGFKPVYGGTSNNISFDGTAFFAATDNVGDLGTVTNRFNKIKIGTGYSQFGGSIGMGVGAYTGYTGATNGAVSIDIACGGFPADFIGGGDANSSTGTRTNNTAKYFREVTVPYATGLPVAKLFANNQNGTNTLNIGGGRSESQAITTGNLYAATATGTATGTVVASWTINGMALSATPTAPTAAAGTNTTQIATTAFVTTAIVNSAAPTVDIANTTPVNATPGTKYYATHSGLSTLVLPTTIAKGQQILMRGSVGGTGLWRISQNAGQTIHGATNSTTGTGGYIASQAQYDTVALECIVANTDFVIIANRGTLTIV